MGLLKGKVAVITGGTRGLGWATARAYVREDAAVVVGSRSADAVERAMREMHADGAQVAGQACDVTDLRQVEALANLAVATFGRLDIWINNAGSSAPYGPMAQIPPDLFRRSVDTIVLGSYHGSLVALRHLLPRGTGKLVNVLGWGARRPAPLQTAYGASKAWLRNFTLAVAEENRRTGVGVFAFSPGMMPTDLLTRVEAIAGYEGRVRALERMIPMLANPPEVAAEKLVWLVSSATDGRTGLEVRVSSPAGMLLGALRYQLQQLLSGRAARVEVQVTTVPPTPPVLGRKPQK